MTATDFHAPTVAETLDKLADRIRPGSPSMRKLLSLVTSVSGPDYAPRVSARLERAAECLTARPARVTFGGYFSSGKSSLINMLIGRPLLPTDDFPETGVPCLLQSGTGNRVLVRTGDGAQEVPFTTAAISQYVTLTGADGTVRSSIRAVRDVQITLGNGAIPADATWVDSPGISDAMDDDPVRKELPATLARAGDVLVWVVNSAQDLSLTEQEFLAARIEEAGPASVVFVVNAFLTPDTPQAWQTFTARKGYVGRITQNISTGNVPLRIVVASARAAATVDRDGFGGPEARALLTAHSSPNSPRVLATRVFRAVAELRAVAATLDELVTIEERRVAAADATATAEQAARVREHEEFLREVRREIAGVFNENRDLGGDAAWEATPGTNESLSSPDYYGDRFVSELRYSIDRFVDDLESAIDRCASDHNHSYFDYDGKQEIKDLLAPDSIGVSGASDDGSAAGGTVAGAVVGGAIGALFGGFGAIPGAAIGGAIGRALGKSSSSGGQRDAIARALSRAGRTATAKILDAQSSVVRIAQRTCTQYGDPVPPPSQDDLEAMRKARKSFNDDIVSALSSVLAVTLSAVDASS